MLTLYSGQLGGLSRSLSYLWLERLLFHFEGFHYCLQIYRHCSSKREPFNSSKPSKPESSERFNHIGDRAVWLNPQALHYCRHSFTPVSHYLYTGHQRVFQTKRSIRNNMLVRSCTLTTIRHQHAKISVPTKEVSYLSCLLLVSDTRKWFLWRFATNYTSNSPAPTGSPSSTAYLSLLRFSEENSTTRCVIWTCANNPAQMVYHLSSLKRVPLSWLFLYFTHSASSKYFISNARNEQWLLVPLNVVISVTRKTIVQFPKRPLLNIGNEVKNHNVYNKNIKKTITS